MKKNNVCAPLFCPHSGGKGEHIVPAGTKTRNLQKGMINDEQDKKASAAYPQ